MDSSSQIHSKHVRFHLHTLLCSGRFQSPCDDRFLCCGFDKSNSCSDKYVFSDFSANTAMKSLNFMKSILENTLYTSLFWDFLNSWELIFGTLLSPSWLQMMDVYLIFPFIGSLVVFYNKYLCMKFLIWKYVSCLLLYLASFLQTMPSNLSRCSFCLSSGIGWMILQKNSAYLMYDTCLPWLYIFLKGTIYPWVPNV